MRLTTTIAVAAFCMAAAGAPAASRVWLGGQGLNLWSTPANWQGGIAPVPGDRLVFSEAAASAVTVNDFVNIQFDAIEIRSNVSHIFRGEPITLSSTTPLSVQSAALLITFQVPLRFVASSSRVTVRPAGADVASFLFGPIVTLGPLVVDAPNANIDFDDIVPFVQAGLDLTAGVVRMPGTNNFSRDIFITARHVVAGPNALGLQSAVTYMRPGSGALVTTAARTGTQRYDLRGTGADAGMSLHDGIVTELFVEGTQKIEVLGTLALRGPIFGPGRIVLDGRPESSTVFSRHTDHTFTGGLEIRNGRLSFDGPNAMPEENDLAVNGPSAVIATGTFNQRVRKFACNGGVVEWTPSGTPIEGLEGVSLNGCQLVIKYTPGTVPDLEELTVIRNNTVVSNGQFDGLPPGKHIIIDGVDRVVAYGLGGSRSDVALVRASTRGDVVASGAANLSVPIGGVIGDPLSVRAVNAQGNPRINTTLRATVQPAGCGTFPGGVASVEVLTDSNGRANVPAFTGTGYNVVCTIAMSTIGGFEAAGSVDIVVYDPATLRLVFPSPYALVSSGVVTTYTARLMAGGESGVGVPGVPFAWEVRATGSAGASPTGATQGNTGAGGYATFETLPNSLTGSYRVSVQTPTREAVVQVTQASSLANRTRSDPIASSNLVSVMDGGVECRIASASFETKLPAPLRGWTFPRGFVRLAATGCTGGTVHFRASDAQRPLRRNGVFMRYGPTASDTTPHWHVLAGGAQADIATHNFALVDGVQDDDLAANGSISALVAFAVPAADYQDMWWAGAAENGWGASLVQHRDTIFAVVYAYDNAGKPIWYVMPGGSWDAAHKAYSGALFSPRGSPFFAYNAAALVVGNAVGNATLRFTDPDHAVLEFSIGGVTGTKLITRQSFGDSKAYAPVRGDMWWGGDSQNGWGIASLAQGSKLFSVWFTYDAAGAPTWFVMPNGAFSLADRRFEGRIFRTTGSQWLGAPYNAAQLQVIDTGAFRFDFSGETARFGYSADGHGGTLELVRQPF